MNSSALYLVVIAGGNGTRFWPKSTSKRPKQLLSFGSGTSLLTQTIARFDGLVPKQQRIIVTTQSLEVEIQKEALGVQILAEPSGRNTAPCIYWAARHIAEKDPEGIMLVMPSDHHIAFPEKFSLVLKEACQWASEHNELVTLGIQPTRPETGYGYLKTEGYPADSTELPSAIKKVRAFVEKPNLAKAQEFLNSGNYFWNGGMFVWRAKVILEAFDEFMPEMKIAWNQAEGHVEAAYPKMTATSIDYGIMEKAKNVVMFPLDCGWDDLGSWTSLENLAESLGARQGENVVSGGHLLSIDSTGNIVDVPGRLITLLGVNDLIVVEHGSTVMVAHKSRAQDIRRMVEEVKKVRPELV
jgi:mannose-1-phosphate guanylyltransferase